MEVPLITYLFPGMFGYILEYIFNSVYLDPGSVLGSYKYSSVC